MSIRPRCSNFAHDNEMNNTDDIDTINSSYSAARFLAGFGYISIFSGLSWLTAIENNIDPVGLLMLINIPEHIVKSLSNYAFPDFNGKEDYAFLFSLGFLYGVSLLISSLIPFATIFSNMAHQKIHIFTATSGLILGYIATIIISERFGLFGAGELGIIVYYVKFQYIYLSYLIVCFAKGLIPVSHHDYVYYEMIADGFFMAAAYAIILTGRDVTLLSIFTGPLFLTFSALAMLLINKTIFRIYMKMWIIILHLDTLTENESSPTTVKSRFTLLKLIIRDSFKNSFDEDEEQYALALSKISLGNPKTPIKTTMHIDIREMLSIFILLSGWPWVILYFYEKIRFYFGGP